MSALKVPISYMHVNRVPYAVTEAIRNVLQHIKCVCQHVEKFRSSGFVHLPYQSHFCRKSDRCLQLQRFVQVFQALTTVPV